jgi:hypothetical protein
MRLTAGHRARGRNRIIAWLAAWSIGGAMAPTGCTVDRDDSYELLRRGAERAPGAPTPLRYAGDNDASASQVRRLMADELSGELLRTFAMARRLVAETAPPASAGRALARFPPYLVLGVSDLDRGVPYRERELRAGWWRQEIPARAPIIWIDDEPARSEAGRVLASVRPKEGAGASDAALRDAVVLEQIVSGFGQAIVSLIAPVPGSGVDVPPASADPLGEGYATFLQVVAAEWHSRSGDSIANDARAVLQRAPRFAAVRGSTSAAVLGVPPADTDALLRDPRLIAAFLYRLATSETGHRLAPDDIYRAMVPERPPPGISPGRLLGSFRNFQAKLLWAWNRTVILGEPPRDLVDLVDAYAAAFPAERAEVIRIFLVTTGAATVQPGGVSDQASPDEAASRYAALTTDVLFGRLDLRGRAYRWRSSRPYPIF